jgi:hypothetical protein
MHTKLIGRREGKIALSRHGRRWVEKVYMDRREIGCHDVG